MVTELRWATLIIVGSAVVAACQPGGDNATTDTGTGALGGTGTGGAGTTINAQTLGTVLAVHSSEVGMGQIAEEKATNAEVRQFAQRIVREHQSFLQRGQQLSMQGDTAQADRQLVQMADSTMQRLRAMSRGAAFDTAFVNSQVRAHEAALQRLDQMTGQSGQATGQGAGQTGTAGGAGTGTAGGTGTGTAGGTGMAGSTDTAGGANSQNPSDYVSASRQAIQAHLEAARQLQQQLGGGQR